MPLSVTAIWKNPELPNGPAPLVIERRGSLDDL